eukprot:4669065-Amphidinium_carterae.1
MIAHLLLVYTLVLQRFCHAIVSFCGKLRGLAVVKQIKARLGTLRELKTTVSSSVLLAENEIRRRADAIHITSAKFGVEIEML